MMATERQAEIKIGNETLVNYCGECEMPVEYCVYGQKPQRCLKWLQQNLPEIFSSMTLEDMEGYRSQIKVETVIIPEIRAGRFASIGSLDEFKKIIVRKARS